MNTGNITKIKDVKLVDYSPEDIARAKDIYNNYISKFGRIKISDISPEIISRGREIIESLNYSQFDFMTGNPCRFDVIEEPVQLAHYLASKAKISALSEEFVSHYTSYEKASKILSNRMFHLNNPKNMNDGLEFNSENMDASKIYFASFSLENGENIGMWSMYGQPWKNGVKISIPKKLFIDWIKSIKEIYNVDPESYKPIVSAPICEKMFTPSISRVAYVEWGNEGEVRRISCGEAKNEKLKKVDECFLTGLIKDYAWAYEKEIRLRVDLKNKTNVNRVAVIIPDEIMDSIVVTTGPRFDEKAVRKEELRTKRIEKSIFTGKLEFVYCDECENNKIK